MSETRKYDFVDALRGWAVLGVIFAHTPLWGKFGVIVNVIGATGVQLFYVLSAFTLFLSLSQKSATEANPIRNFFIRRFCRIAPMFYLSAIFFLCLNGTGPSFWAPHGLSWWHIVTTFTFTNGWHPETINTIVPGGWSVAVETTFYALFPMLFLVSRAMWKSVVLTGVLLVLGVVLSPAAVRFYRFYPPEQQAIVNYFAELWLPAQACVFALGFCLYHLFKSPRQPRSQGVRAVLSAVMLLVVAWGSVAIAQSDRYRWLPHPFLFGLLYVLMTYALALRPYRLFVNRWMIYLGKISFSVYLLHSIGIHLGKHLASQAGIDLSCFGGLSIVLGVTIPLTVILATLTYQWVELPGIAWGKKWISRMESELPARSAEVLVRST